MSTFTLRSIINQADSILVDSHIADNDDDGFGFRFNVEHDQFMANPTQLVEYDPHGSIFVDEMGKSHHLICYVEKLMLEEDLHR